MDGNVEKDEQKTDGNVKALETRFSQTKLVEKEG